MTVGTILLTKSNKYIDDSGRLPKRPSFDKTLLTALINGRAVSTKGYEMLPPSMQQIAYRASGSQFEVPITISELGEAELLIVSRSTEEFTGGKEFRLSTFNCIARDKHVEIWIKSSRG